MPNWIEPIIDRSQDDVDRIIELNNIGWFNMTPLEKAEWLSDSKGAINRSDLERIETDIQVLSDTMELDLTTNINNVPDILNASYFDDLLSNVQAIRDYGIMYLTTPEVPNAPINTFSKMNDVEKILWDVHEILTRNFHYYAYSTPEIYAGESFGLLL